MKRAWLKEKRLVLGLLVALLISAAALPAAAADLVILHTNDIHGRIEPVLDGGVLGMPYIAAIIAEYRSQYPNVLVMDAGDTIHGRPVTDRLHGESTVAAMNIAGYDVMVPGNHDFNFGYQQLLALEEQMDFHLVAANVFKDDELLFDPYVIKEFAGFTVGIFGLATPDTYSTTHPDNIRGLVFGDMIEASQRYVSVLRDEYGVDLVIALGHVGFGRNYPVTDVLAAVSGIDIFVDGHSHTRLPEGEWHHGTFVVQAYEHAKYLGKVVIELQQDEPSFTASLISAEEGFTYEPVLAVEELLEEARAEVRRRLLGN